MSIKDRIYHNVYGKRGVCKIRGLKIFMAVLMIAIVAYIAVHFGRNIGASAEAINGVKVIIDPGHGGGDPGKIGVNDVLEKDVNLQIAFKLKKLLEKKGVSVVMTREEDTSLGGDESGSKKVADLKSRIKMVENEKADIMVSIHQNSYSSEKVKGAQVFYYTNSDEGKKLSEYIQNSIKESVDKDNNRAAKANNNYYILLHSACPAVIVECGFLSNHEEAAKLSDKDYQQDMAEAIADGVFDYLSAE